jgi:hypothetical protein
MYVHRTIYKGYSISLAGADSNWSFRIERLTPEFPLLSHPLSEGHRSWGRALSSAKREIDRIVSVIGLN